MASSGGASHALGRRAAVYLGSVPWQRERHTLPASEPGLQADQDYDSATIPWAVWWAKPMVVIIGFTPEAPGNTLLSATKIFDAPRSRPSGSHAERCGSVPSGSEPIWCALNSRLWRPVRGRRPTSVQNAS